MIYIFSKHKYSHAICALITTVVSAIILLTAISMLNYSPQASVDGEVYLAKVVEIVEVVESELFEGAKNYDITFLAEIESGEHKGENIEMLQSVNEMFFPTPIAVEVSDSILVSYADMTDDNIDNSEWFYMTHNKFTGIIILVVLFVILIVIIGSFKGIYAVLSLVISIITIFMLFIPSIVMGQNIYVWTIFVTVFIICSNLLILGGFNKKTLCAVLGNVGGILVSGIVALVVNYLLGITGAIDQDYLLLTMLPGDVAIDLRAMVWAGVLIGALGAIMDVSMSISSAMNEISIEMSEYSFSKMVKAGMNIGRDAIATMTNTLILAYIGSSLAPVVLFAAYNRNILILMNFEMIMIEIISAIVGSIGILLSVPVTVLFAAFIMKKKSISSDNIENLSENES